MKIIKKFYFALLISFISCSTSDDEFSTFNHSNENTQSLELTKKNNIHKTTNVISILLFKLGVEKIIVDKTNNDLIRYNFKTFKSFITKGEFIDLSNYTIILESGTLYLESEPNYKISLNNGEIYLRTSPDSELIKQNNISDNISIRILKSFLIEMTASNEVKMNFQNHIDNIVTEKRVGCSFWDTYVVFSGVMPSSSHSLAEANLQDEIAAYASELSGCRKVGGVDTSCVSGNHACWSTQNYCCD
ncbi:hypothetical protein SAMN05444278_101438 [Psychroflexus salarius]|uniref:Uncharacterized protein n=1 Tax=Psychroflexus salarius TaxID=1155689 RepID=A0A1M4T199_9FLAO|nr:hypothetical protein [Psychroflexus salarius]SHE38185.1 hypothetical protein SAMN05444278_101438 [Psychroflexus salarius]